MKNEFLDMKKAREEKERELYLKAFEEGYQASQVRLNKLEEENERLKKIEVVLYEEYDKKVMQMKDWIVTKVDEFLAYQGVEILKGKTAAEIVEEAINT